MSWLTTYMRWTSALESPTVFHRWCAITAVAEVLGRRVWMSRGAKYAIYPAQISAVLVGDSALVKKGIAMRQALMLLAALPAGIVNILPEKTSPQELLSQLRPRDADGTAIEDIPAVGLIVAEELGAFFSSEGFLETMATHVTRLHDAPHGLIDPETRAVTPILKEYAFRSWRITLRDPCCHILGGTTPEGVAREIPPAARKAGFFGRVFWIYAETSDRPPNSLTTTVHTDATLQEALIRGLETMALYRGPIGFSRQGRLWFDRWFYKKYHAHLEAMGMSPSQEIGFVGRKPDHVLRVAIVLAACRAADDEGPFAVMEADLELALEYVTAVERQLPAAMREVGTAATAQPSQHFLALLAKHPAGLSRARVLSTLWRKGVFAKTLDEQILPTLLQSGAVTSVTVGGQPGYARQLSAGGHLKRVQEHAREDDEA